MRKLLNARLGMFAFVTAFGAVVGVASAAGDNDQATASVKRVSVKDNYFSPRSATVEKDGKVTWTWKGDNTHNVTFTKVPKRASKRGHDDQDSGHFTRSFGKEGRYSYVCTNHAGMRGSVTAE